MEPEPYASPCVRSCCLDENDICIGCFRSLSEIAGWSEADDEARRAILEHAAQRKIIHALKWAK